MARNSARSLQSPPPRSQPWAGISAVSLALLAGALGPACGPAPADDGVESLSDSGGVESVMLELTSVPSGVQCISVTAATTSGNVTKNLTQTTGAPTTSLNLGRLSQGRADFKASAFDVACSALGGNAPSWIADPVTVTLKAGVMTTVALTFRANASVVATGNFVGTVSKISMGENATYLAMADGSMRTSGNGATGRATVYTSTLPTFGGIAQIGAFDHLCFLKTDGSVWCMGHNDFGEVGPGAPLGGFASAPVRVPLRGLAKGIAVGGNFTCAILDSAEIFCWGRNHMGQLGDGTNRDSAIPVGGQSIGRGQVYAGHSHACATSGSSTACWGDNTFGQLGDGTFTERNTPATIEGLGATVAMALGQSHSCALRADGTVRCWGRSAEGQVGDGTNGERLTPSLVIGISDATDLGASDNSTCVRRQNGTVACWGQNFNGELGNGTGEARNLPQVVPGLMGASSIGMGHDRACALLDDGTMRCWGGNFNGELGDGTMLTRFRPVPVQIL